MVDERCQAQTFPKVGLKYMSPGCFKRLFRGFLFVFLAVIFTPCDNEDMEFHEFMVSCPECFIVIVDKNMKTRGYVICSICGCIIDSQSDEDTRNAG